jgi:cell pole-organizing protein PopZ
MAAPRNLPSDSGGRIRDNVLIMGEIQQDPSMEDILASIKRVIAEDGRTAAAAAPRQARSAARAEPPPAEEPEDVLELDDPLSDGGSLLSPDATAASRQKLAALSALRDRAEGAGAANGGGEDPLGAVVREMLRPMLKEWLDQHLPELVEELVTREITRITGRGL